MASDKSTIVRPGLTPPLPPRAPRAVRTAFTVLDRTAPSLAGHLARRAWFHLPAVPDPDRRNRHVPPGGEAFVVRRNGFEVHGVTFGRDDAPTAVLVHGWGGWWQQLGAFVEPLLAEGYRVVAHDAPSHGDSPAGRHGPRSSTVPEMAAALEAVTWQQGPADLVVAHSLGAMVATHARGLGVVADGYAFIAPAVDVEEMFPWFQHVLGVGDRTVPRLRASVERHVGLEMAALSVLDAARAIRDAEGVTNAGPNPPRLVALHSRDDADNPARGSVALVDLWPGADLHLTDGLGHRRILWDAETVKVVADFARGVRA